MPGITAVALELFQAHPWPGNVRELQQTLLRAAFNADGTPIDENHVRRAIAVGASLDLEPEPRTLAAARCNHVQEVVAACSGDTQRAAALLGISRRHVYRLLHASPSTVSPGSVGAKCMVARVGSHGHH